MSQKGRSIEAEAEFERLLGGSHVKSAIAELSKSDRGDEVDAVKFSELFYGRYSKGTVITLVCIVVCLLLDSIFFQKFHTLLHFAVVFIGSVLFALQQLSGINAVFYFSSAVFKSAGVPADTANMFVALVNLTGRYCLLC